MTNEEDLIEQARQAGQAYIDSFKGDDKAMLKDLRRRERTHVERVVRLPAKPPRKRCA